LLVGRDFVLNFFLFFFVVLVLADDFLQLISSVVVTGLIVEHTSLDDNVIEALLVSCLLQHAFFNWGSGDEPVNSDFMLLPNTMRPVLGLLIHLRVPVGVKDNDSVGHLQVEAVASCLGREYEHLLNGVRV